MYINNTGCFEDIEAFHLTLSSLCIVSLTYNSVAMNNFPQFYRALYFSLRLRALKEVVYTPRVFDGYMGSDM